jgi:hypothetical protein
MSNESGHLGGQADSKVFADQLFDVFTVIAGAAALLERRWDELGEAGRGELVGIIDKGVERGVALMESRDLPWLEWQLDHYFVLVRVAALTLASPGSGHHLRREAAEAIRGGAAPLMAGVA